MQQPHAKAAADKGILTHTFSHALAFAPSPPRRCVICAPVTPCKQARQLALALPELLEQDHHGRRSFRVAGKIFATLWDEDHMNVMLDEPGIHVAVQRTPDTCAEFWWGKRLRALHVNLEQIAPDELAELLADAWEQKVPRKLVEQERRA